MPYAPCFCFGTHNFAILSTGTCKLSRTSKNSSLESWCLWKMLCFGYRGWTHHIQLLLWLCSEFCCNWVRSGDWVMWGWSVGTADVTLRTCLEYQQRIDSRCLHRGDEASLGLSWFALSFEKEARSDHMTSINIFVVHCWRMPGKLI